MPPHALAAVVARRLGSRLYFEFTAAALGDDAAWEGLADGVAVEVRRHGAPAAAASPQSPSAVPVTAQVTAQDSVGEATPAMVLAPTALAAAAPARRVAAAAGVGMRSVVHVDNRNTVNNTNSSASTNNSTNNSHFGNTSTNSIVLM